MRSVNAYDIETPHGLRSFELLHGAIPAFDRKVDLLVLSALPNDLEILRARPDCYDQIRHTILGALKHEAGIDVAELSRSPALDLRAGLGCWLSSTTSSPMIGSIVCVEGIGVRAPLTQCIDDLFLALGLMDQKGLSGETVAIPLLGSGAAGFNAAEVLQPILTGARELLLRSNKVDRVLFVERADDKVEALDREMDQQLARAHVALPRGQLVSAIRSELLEAIDAATRTAGEQDQRVLLEGRRVLADPEARSYQIGITGRRFVEIIVRSLHPSNKDFELWKKIEALGQVGVADWVRSYLHTLRIFGNEAAHDRRVQGRKPSTLAEADIALALFCMERVVKFWSSAGMSTGADRK